MPGVDDWDNQARVAQFHDLNVLHRIRKRNILGDLNRLALIGSEYAPSRHAYGLLSANLTQIQRTLAVGIVNPTCTNGET